MANRETRKNILFMAIKIAVLAAGWYFFTDRILKFAAANEMKSVAIYSGIFAAIVLVMMLMFRWSGFFARVFAAALGIAALASILVKHVTAGVTVTAFIGIYSGILILTLIAAYFILFRKIEI